MKTFLTAALAAFFVLTAHAIAQVVQEPSVVTIPWGAWLSAFLDPLQDVIGVILLAAATAVLAMAPSWVQEMVRPLILTWRVDQLFGKAAATAIAGVKGSTAGKEVTITVANDLVRTLLGIAVDRGAPLVLDFAGKTARGLAEKALARLHEQGVVLPVDYTLTDASVQADAVLRARGEGVL